MTFSFAPDVVLQVIDDEALILKLQQEVVFALNETGARIAHLIGEGQSIDLVSETLAREYERCVTEIRPEVERLIEVLKSKGVLVVGRRD
jgi:fumarate hydratase class II